jgi:anti-anti-sigma factor
VGSTLTITDHQDGAGRTVLALRGEADIATAPRLRAAVSEHLDRCETLVLDVTGAVLIDAAGLRVLAAAQREAASLGKTPVVLRGVRPLLAKTLHLTGLDHLFTREPALQPTVAHPAPAISRSATPSTHAHKPGLIGQDTTPSQVRRGQPAPAARELAAA